MSHPVSDKTPICNVAQQRMPLSRRQINWVFGVVLGVAVCALLAVAAICAPSSVRSNNARCLEELAAQEHASVEAFFQNPAGQDALAQAVEQCSR